MAKENKENKVKNYFLAIIVLIGAVLAISVIIGGIVTLIYPVEKEFKPFDKNISLENSATLVIPMAGNVTRFNGKKVKWNPGYSVFGKVSIPAGNFNLTLNYKNKETLWKYSVKNVDLNGTLPAGKIFMVKFTMYDENLKKMVKTSIVEVSQEEYEELLHVSNRFFSNVKIFVFSIINLF